MNPQALAVAQSCLDGAAGDTMTFPAIVGRLMEAGFESYLVDYRRRVAIYYRPDGDSVELISPIAHPTVGECFDAALIAAAIREAQHLAPGYTYRGFCDKVTAAGCAGYMVSFSGRRALYFGRTGETHVELFP